MEKKKDLRVVKTEKLLFTTIMELMKTKPLEEIKVSDICREAMINRSTFYAHYADKYELLVDLIAHIKMALTEVLQKNNCIINTKEYYIEMLKLILDFMEDKRDVYYSILINNRNSISSDIIIDAINQDLSKRIQEGSHKMNGIPSEIVSVFYLGGVASVVVDWLKNSHKYSKQEIIDSLTKLLPDNIGSL